MKSTNSIKPCLALTPALLLAALFCSLLSNDALADLSDGLVAWWKLDEPSGTTAADSSGLGNHGILSTNMARVSGAPPGGTALFFSGADRVSVNDSASLNITGSITIAAWVKAEDWNGDPRILAKGVNGNWQYQLLVQGSSSLGLILMNPGYNEVANPPPSTGVWHHIAGTFNGSTMSLYIDGTVVNQRAVTGSIITTTQPLNIGSIGGLSFFKGAMSDVRIYNRALSSDEISQLFVPSSPPLISQQPTNVLLQIGSDASFGIVVKNSLSSFYQWKFNGIALTNGGQVIGANSPLLVISNAQSTNVGVYFVVVTNIAGSVTSAPAILMGLTAPADDDHDGLPNWWETTFGLDSNNSTDAANHPPGDQLTQFQKYLYGLNPLTPDTDGDDLNDFDEVFVYHTNPLSPDTDGDGMPDGWEVSHGLNPLMNDANEDADFDGVSNAQEYQYSLTHTNQLDPRELFSQSGVSDYSTFTGGEITNRFYYDRNDRLLGEESSRGISFAYVYDGNDNLTRQAYLSRASETNGLPVLWRFLNGITNDNPYADSDGDGWTDYQEWRAGSNPRDAQSTPNLFGNPGTNIAALSLPFTPSNFVVGVGQLDGAAGDEIVVGGDGVPNGTTNSILVLINNGSTWTTQKLDDA